MGCGPPMRARLNEYCLERVVQFCLEPLFCAEGDIAPSRRVAQPRLAALMQVSKVVNAWASKLLYRHVSLDIKTLITSLLGDAVIQLLPLVDDKENAASTSDNVKTLSDNRQKQLASIETMHLDMQDYIDEDDDPELWRPAPLVHILAYHVEHQQQTALQQFRESLPDPQNFPDTTLPPPSLVLPRLTAITLFRAGAVWRLDWPAKVLFALARLSDIRTICYSSHRQAAITSDELAAFLTPIYFGPASPHAQAGAPASTSHSVTFRHHCATWKPIPEFKISARFIVDFVPHRRVHHVRQEALVRDLAQTAVAVLSNLDHTQRPTAEREDVTRRSVYMFGLDLLFDKLLEPPRRPVTRPAAPLTESIQIDDMRAWKRQVLNEVEEAARSRLQRGWYEQYIAHDQFFIKPWDELPACDFCGRRGGAYDMEADQVGT